MPNLTIYIVEDEALYANELEILVDKLDYELVGMSDNSDEAKKEITSTTRANHEMLVAWFGGMWFLYT